MSTKDEVITMAKPWFINGDHVNLINDKVYHAQQLSTGEILIDGYFVISIGEFKKVFTAHPIQIDVSK